MYKDESLKMKVSDLKGWKIDIKIDLWTFLILILSENGAFQYLHVNCAYYLQSNLIAVTLVKSFLQLYFIYEFTVEKVI